MKTKLLIILVIVFWTLPLLAQEVDTAWVRRYNGPANSYDYAQAVAVDGCGNVYVIGTSYGSSTYDDYATIKYYPNGDTAWVRRYDGPENFEDWAAAAIAVDGSGNVYLTGTTLGISGRRDYATIKYQADGDTAWVRIYNGLANGHDFAYAIAVDSSGNVYVTGTSYGSGTYDDYATIKYYPNGDTAWVRRYNGPGNYLDWANAIAVDGLGNVYVTGYDFGSSPDYATIKYYPNGDTAWVRRYNGPADSLDGAVSIAVDAWGNVYVTGTSYGSGTGEDYATIRYYPDGDTAWLRRYNGPADSSDEASEIVVDSWGNVYVTGRSYGTGTSFDYATIKYSSNGDTAWVRRYNGPADSLDGARSIAVDAWGNVYVTGTSYGSGTGEDYATMKYCANGDAAWVTRYNGPEDSTDWASAIAINDSGNVYVTGYSYGIGTDLDYATIKYYQHNDPPDPFSLLSPWNKKFIPILVQFDWETATDPNPCDQVRYDLYVSTSPDFSPEHTTIDSDLVESEFEKALDPGIYCWKVKAKDNWGAERWSNQTRHFIITGLRPFPGDLNGDGSINASDVVFLINYLYKSGTPPDPLELADVNCDGAVNAGDVVFLINYLFKNGPPPSC
jgi:uncharacterized delta-60 repeat protein